MLRLRNFPTATVRAIAALALALGVIGTAVTTMAAPTGAAPASRPTSSKMSKTEISYARSVLRLLNAERRAHKLPALRIGKALTRAAHVHNRAMAGANNISHQLPGERGFADRDRSAGWRPRCYGGENIGVNGRMDRSGATELQSLMYNERPPEDGHRQNILNVHYTHVGIAVLIDKRNDRLWLTTDFAARKC